MHAPLRLPADLGGNTPWQALLADPALVFRLNGDANGDGTGDANDYAGNYNGTWIGSPAYDDPPPNIDGKSFSFSGTNGIDLDSAAGDFNDKFTISFWLNPPTQLQGGAWLSKRSPTSTAWGTYIQSGTINFADDGNNFSLIAGMVASAWNHLCFVIDGANSRLYLNNVAKPTFSPNITTSALNLSIGYRKAFNDAYYTGRIADLRIYDRVLSIDEVATLHAGNA